MQSWIRWWCLRRYRAMRGEQQDNIRRLAEKMRLAACGGQPATEEIVQQFLRLPPEGRREVLDVLEMCVRQGWQWPQGEYPAARASSAEL